MENKLVTIVVLPYSKARGLKNKLSSENIECSLKDLHLMEGAAKSVEVKIREKDMQKAIPILDEFLGKRPFLKKEGQAKDQHILVPVDFSEVSFNACKMAFNIASHLKVKLVFMHCYINPLIHSVPYTDVYVYDSSLLTRMDNAEKTANDNFAKFIERFVNEIGQSKWKTVDAEFIIKSGYPDEDILAYARDNSSRLIVMAAGGKAGTIMGSVTADIIYNANVPVLVIPERSPEKELSEFNNVLYATNFDEKDFIVIDKLIKLLSPYNVKIFCVHVGKTGTSDWDKAKLDGMNDILKKRYGEKYFECRLILDDDILHALDKFIADENIDILSLTTHKRNMISRLFNPSIARKMVFHAQTPLLIFHA